MVSFVYYKKQVSNRKGIKTGGTETQKDIKEKSKFNTDKENSYDCR